jgi:DNA ligase-1
MKILSHTPLLVSKTRTGKDKFWRGEVVSAENGFTATRSEYWQSDKNGKESKHQFSIPTISRPTNVGRSNERDSFNQAMFDLDVDHKKHLDKGYTKPGEKSNILPLPMLAQKFKERGGKIQWPGYCQPKLNGQRMLYDGTKAWSRGGKLIIPEVIEHLEFNTKGNIIDGELILKVGNKFVLLQETMKAAKKYRKELSPNLYYFVYDIVDKNLPFSKRYTKLKELVKNAPAQVVLVDTFILKNEADLAGNHAIFVRDGYEGTMIRDDSCGYDIGHRSNSLQKFKDFCDAEFIITDVISGEGSDTGLAIFTCETDKGLEFNCRPQGNRETRRELLADRKNLIGEYLTVQYFELTADGKPQFPVGICVRDGADFKE